MGCHLGSDLTFILGLGASMMQTATTRLEQAEVAALCTGELDRLATVYCGSPHGFHYCTDLADQPRGPAVRVPKSTSVTEKYRSVGELHRLPTNHQHRVGERRSARERRRK
jgi:hypothetical protein